MRCIYEEQRAKHDGSLKLDGEKSVRNESNFSIRDLGTSDFRHVGVIPQSSHPFSFGARNASRTEFHIAKIGAKNLPGERHVSHNWT